MQIIKTLQTIQNFINYKKTYKHFEIIDKQKEYLNSFEDPETDIERSYYQYKCQKYLEGFNYFILNILSLPILVYFKYLRKNNIINNNKKDAVITNGSIRLDKLPKKLISQYEEWVIDKGNGEYFDNEDRRFFREISNRYPFSFLFQLKCLIKLRNYSYLIHMYNPKGLVTCGEYSFTSSILTLYCEIRNIKHIDIMHGEKIFYIRDAFFRFHEIYVWHEHYIQLFKKLRADKNNFLIFLPDSFRIDCEGYKIINDYTYYLQIASKSQLIIIEQKLRNLKNKGFIIAIRPHPIASNIKEVKEVFKGYIIEDCNKICIEQSIRNTKCLISLYSTVLLQGYYSKKTIMIDDCSNRTIYDLLDKMNYIGNNLPHLLLSEIDELLKE